MELLSIFFPTDGGPMYQEFIAHTWIKEPWNALSSLLFFIPVLYYGFKTNWKIKKYPLWYWMVPFLVINGLGSTLYHAFRDTTFFMQMDFGGAAVAAMLVMLYFWKYVVKNWWVALVILVMVNLFRLPIYLADVSHQTFINIQYFISGVSIGIPIVIFLVQNKAKHVRSLLLTIIFMLLAITFRLIDKEELLPFPMGTHFLWHLCTTLGLFPLSQFLIQEQDLFLSKNTTA